MGLYRDDGLCVTVIREGELTEFREKIVQVFEKEGLKIEYAEHLLKSVNFLDVTMHMETGEYEPFRKPGPPPKYVHRESNHPPAIVKNLPAMIEKRISGLCSSQEMFNKHAPFYNKALRNSGYMQDIKFIEQNEQKQAETRKSRHKEKIWYNPPWNKAVSTNVGKKFLQLVDKHFPKGSKWRSLFNRSTVKISYCCSRNMAAYISGKNKKLLRDIQGEAKDERPCPSNDDPCPLSGKYSDKCRTKSVVYQAIISSEEKSWNYIGLTSRTFHDRWREHKNDMRNKERPGTALSAKIWSLKEAGAPYKIRTEIIQESFTYKTGDSQCDLCLTEKTCIALHDKAPKKLLELPVGCKPLNIRTEIMNGCRHKIEYKLIGRKKPTNRNT